MESGHILVGAQLIFVESFAVWVGWNFLLELLHISILGGSAHLELQLFRSNQTQAYSKYPNGVTLLTY